MVAVDFGLAAALVSPVAGARDRRRFATTRSDGADHRDRRRPSRTATVDGDDRRSTADGDGDGDGDCDCDWDSDSSTSGSTAVHPELATTISIIQGRIASTGVVGATVEAEGTDRIVVTLPGIADADAEPIPG